MAMMAWIININSPPVFPIICKIPKEVISIPDIIFPNLGVTIDNLNRVAISIANFNIYWYAIFVATGIAAGIFFGAYVAPRRTGQNPSIYMDFAIIVCPACILGARIFYVIFNMGHYRHNLAGIFNFRSGGLAIYGVVITAFLVAVIFARIKKLNFLHFADTGIVGLVIGHAIGRFGNFTNREAFGSYTDSLFAIQMRLDQVHNLGIVTNDMIVYVDNL
ncbi:MAG: prolipoprotein diacylglyceryl transferase, partial [Defluviitaleaceae bacterium]|nr:prolipoprotein diacylglyceryl transferase [Defluviitaleaceae bacterium]